MKKKTIALLILAVVLSVAAGSMYIGIGMHYMTHFFERTTVNGLDVSDLTVEEAEALLASEVEDYRITIRTRGGAEEVIRGDQIGYRFVSGGEMQEFLDGQNFLAWLPAYISGERSHQVEAAVVYDETLLRQAMNELVCMQEANITKAQDAHLAQQDGKYVIAQEVEGNEPDAEKVYAALLEAARTGAVSVDLEEQDCYRKPSVLESDGALRAEAAVMNRYTTISVTYQMGGGVTEVLDSATIAGWFSLDEQKQPVFDRNAVASWVNQLADKYDTIGTWPEFVTSNGETVWPEARTYGWQMDRESETEELYQMLLAGESGEREPVYLETARTRGSNDIGDTYVEIDYTNQRMWYYKDGALLVETPVVTGNVSLGQSSPEGIFCLVDKQRDAILKGEGYETPVSYWMPFYGGVGIHDADSWRSSYGGTIYQYGGSHGCINTPTAQAAVIFENIEVGTPIICYSSGINYGYQEIGVQGGGSSGGAANGNSTVNGNQPADGTVTIDGNQPSGSTGGQDGVLTDGNIVILDGGGAGASGGNPEDWADESLYYGNGNDVMILPDNSNQQ